MEYTPLLFQEVQPFAVYTHAHTQSDIMRRRGRGGGGKSLFIAKEGCYAPSLVHHFVRESARLPIVVCVDTGAIYRV